MVFFFGVVTLMGRQFVDPQANHKVLFIEALYYVPVLPTIHVSVQIPLANRFSLTLIMKSIRSLIQLFGEVFSVFDLASGGHTSRKRAW